MGIFGSLCVLCYFLMFHIFPCHLQFGYLDTSQCLSSQALWQAPVSLLMSLFVRLLSKTFSYLRKLVIESLSFLRQLSDNEDPICT